MNNEQKRTIKWAVDVAKLRELIDEIDDGALLVVPSFDHSYRSPLIYNGTALLEENGNLTEDFGEEMTPESEYGKRIKVLIIE